MIVQYPKTRSTKRNAGTYTGLSGATDNRGAINNRAAMDDAVDTNNREGDHELMGDRMGIDGRGFILIGIIIL